MVLRVPPVWASNDLYSVGPDAPSGPTKIDPNSPTNGLVRGVAAAAQHINYLLNPLTVLARRACTVNPLRLHALRPDFADNGSNTLAAVQIVQGLPVLAIKAGTGDVAKVQDCDIWSSAGDVASITSNVRGAAYDGTTRIVAIGSGGNLNCFSDDLGATWSAGGALGATCQDIVWNDNKGKFLALASSGSTVKRSADASAWSSASTSLSTSSLGGIAVLSSGRTVVCGQDGGVFPRMSISDDGGATWSDSGGFPADGGISFLGEGYIAGNGGALIWHAGLRGSPASGLRISKSTDGVTWTTVADFTTGANNMPPAAAQPSTSSIRLLCCQNTGLLVVLASKTSAAITWAIASADGGVTWSDPAFFPVAGVTSFALAGGKLFRAVGGTVAASIGIGVPFT